MKIVKLDVIFYDVDDRIMEVFQIVESDFEQIPVYSFILDDLELSTPVEKILNHIQDCVKESNFEQIHSFLYTPKEVNLGLTRAEKFLKQLRRDMMLEVII